MKKKIKIALFLLLFGALVFVAAKYLFNATPWAYFILSGVWELIGIWVIVLEVFEYVEKSWKSYRAKVKNKENNTKIFQAAEKVFHFIKHKKNKLEIPDDVFWSFSEGFEFYLGKYWTDLKGEEKSSVIFVSMLKAYVDFENKLGVEARDVKKWLHESFDVYSLHDIEVKERVLAGVFIKRNEIQLEIQDVLIPVSASKAEAALADVAKSIHARNVYEFFSKLKREKELKETLREIMKSELDVNGDQIVKDAEGSYLILGKSFPKDVIDYFKTIPMLSLPGVTARNIPGVDSKGMVAFLVRPPNDMGINVFAKEVGDRIKKSKDIKRRNKSEAFFVALKSHEVPVVRLNVSEDKNYSDFRNSASYFLTGKYFGEASLFKNPLSVLWNLPISFEDVLKKLPPKILCKNAKDWQLFILDKVYLRVQKTLGVQSLWDWRSKKPKMLREELAKEFQVIRTDADVKFYFKNRAYWGDPIKLEESIKSLANQIIKNSEKYYDGLNN